MHTERERELKVFCDFLKTLTNGRETYRDGYLEKGRAACTSNLSLFEYFDEWERERDIEKERTTCIL